MAFIAIPPQQRSLMIVLFFLAFLLLIPARTKKSRPYFQFVFPTLLVLLFLIIFPFLATLILAVFHVDGTNLILFSWSFVGLENFRSLFTTNLDFFSTWRTLEFSIVAVTIELIIGLVLGFSFARLGNRMDVLRVFFVLPVVIPPLIAGMLWRSIFDQSFGVLNRFIELLGGVKVVWLSLSSPQFLETIGSSKNWLEPLLNLRPGLGCALVTEIWQWTPFVTLIIATALRTLPKEQIEWAKSQGAYSHAMIKHIYIPYILPVVGVVGILRLIDCLKTYESIWTLFANNSQTATLTIRITTYALETRNFGLGAALSVLYIILASVIIIIFAKQFFEANK
ncbi:MAG: carbohydrate ABC transporter permease [Candidatus Thorarchaeota archaeon]